MDRALDQLAAVIDAPGGDPGAHAAVYDELAAAGRAVAEQLAAAGRHEDEVKYSSAKAVCGYCGKPAAKVRKVIASPLLAICDECVALCAELLDDEFGDDWRTRPAQP
jgi:ClpX C4-type zinc finger protein